jgi:2-oxoglutarate ferredoxin oxidoreductase subunit beta
MSKKNPEYDFKWCPGCGDFGVRRALEFAMINRMEESGLPIENNVVVAGIGCSGNLVHLLEGEQPYGIHGIHGRTLPVAMGIKSARPELNVIVVAGDGDFLSIGGEHIAPQAARNVNLTAVIMDNGVYGLTKGQSSPTTEMGAITSSTPFGKIEEDLDPLELYLTLGVSFIASGFSGQPRVLARLINEGMNHQGMSMIHVQSPCVTYNDTYQLIKGNAREGIAPALWDIPDDHDPSDKRAAEDLVRQGGLPVGIIYKDETRQSLDANMNIIRSKARERTIEQMMDAYTF